MGSTPTNEAVREIRGKLTLAEIGVIASLLTSLVTGAFVFGVMYGQVSENTKFRESAAGELKDQGETLASIKTSVDFLVEQNKEMRRNRR